MILGVFHVIVFKQLFAFDWTFIWLILLSKRIDDEDDEMAVIEQDVQRLVIVTQVWLLIT
jgi:hypothetical protein